MHSLEKRGSSALVQMTRLALSMGDETNLPAERQPVPWTAHGCPWRVGTAWRNRQLSPLHSLWEGVADLVLHQSSTCVVAKHLASTAPRSCRFASAPEDERHPAVRIDRHDGGAD